LGLSDLQSLNWALRVRWVWLKKTNSSKPWVAFQLQSSAAVQDLFKMAMASETDDGTETLFWKDRWLNGQRLEDLAPHVSRLVPKRIANRRTVADALDNTRWVQDLHGTVTWLVIQEFLLHWDLLAGVILMLGVPDRHYWCLSQSGQYSAKSAYEALFHGSTYFGAFERIWKTWAPPKSRFFLWLAAHDRCWTADRLAKWNLPHPSLCPLCDQEEETINHLLVECVFSRQLWFILLQQMGLAALAPQPVASSFDDW
jgi:hypothetical protein